MIVTEKEAKEKWCPFARVTLRESNQPVAWNRFEEDEDDPVTPRGTKCLATICMAWRQTDNKTFPTAPGEPERAPEPAGYCGLAGQPHG